MADSPAGKADTEVEVESTVDVEATHLVLEVFVRNHSAAPIRQVRIRPQVHRGDFSPAADAKGIADLPVGRSGRAIFPLEPRGPSRDIIEVTATVRYLDAQGASHRRDAARLRIDLSLPALRPANMDREAFADRASAAFSHPFEVMTPRPASSALRSSVEALRAIPLVPVDESIPDSEGALTRGSLAGLDDRGIGYMARLVAAPRDRGSIIRVTVFAESEVGLFALYHRVREVVEGALRATP